MDMYRQYCEYRDGRPDTDRMTSLDDLGFDPDITGRIEHEIRSLYHRHGPIVFGKRQKAPCAAWRSERIQLADESLSRFVFRIHIFHSVDMASDYGRYLGYIFIRPNVAREVIDTAEAMQEELANTEYEPFLFPTVAYQTVPPNLLRPRYHIITTIGTGGQDGIVPFRSVPYCLPHPSAFNRAYCLHIAIQMALLLKISNYHTKIISSQDLMAAVWKNGKTLPSGWRFPDAMTLDNAPAPDQDPLLRLLNEGASLRDAMRALQSEQCVGAVLDSILVSKCYYAERYTAAGDREEEQVVTDTFDRVRTMLTAIRVMTDYLANGIPLIVRFQLQDHEQPERNYDHASLVIGMHLLEDGGEETHRAFLQALIERVGEEQVKTWRKKYLDYDLTMPELPGRFVIHDDYFGPYYEIEALRFIRWLLVDDRIAIEEVPYVPMDDADDPRAAELAEGWGDEVAPHHLTVRLHGEDIRVPVFTGVTLLAITPRGTKIGVTSVRELSKSFVTGYLNQKPYRTPGSFRYVTRLYTTEQLINSYAPFSHSIRVNDAYHRLRETINDMAAAEDCHRWWSVEVMDPQDKPPARDDLLDADDATATDELRQYPKVIFIYPLTVHANNYYAAPDGKPVKQPLILQLTEAWTILSANTAPAYRIIPSKGGAGYVTAVPVNHA